MKFFFLALVLLAAIVAAMFYFTQSGNKTKSRSEKTETTKPSPGTSSSK